MNYIFPSHKRNTNQTYGPTTVGHYYLAVYYHNKTAKSNLHKTHWVLDEGEQFEVFKISDEGNWFCSKNNCLYSIIDNGNITIGDDDSKIAKFPKPTNNNNTWHGYPIKTEDEQLSESILDYWENHHIITAHIRRKIVRGTL